MLAERHARIFLGRYLTLWVPLCIIAGITLDSIAPAPFQALGSLSVANVNIPVALLIWLTCGDDTCWPAPRRGDSLRQKSLHSTRLPRPSSWRILMLSE